MAEYSEECYRVLTEVFGHDGYKGKQREIVEEAMSGSDVLVIAPTGMGKSLCFQIPAVAVPRGVTLVVSPLIALMKNQVSKLRYLEVEVGALTSDSPHSERTQILAELESGEPSKRLLYITPEKLGTKEIMALLQIVYDNRGLNRLVVDEAHCISEWGHDFRSEYRKLGAFRDRFPNVPIMALTASATSPVQTDILQSLHMSPHTYKVTHPFNRPNLFYEVRYLGAQHVSNPEARMGLVAEYIGGLHARRGRASSGIVYCRTRSMCDDLSRYLRGRGFSARPYHKQIPSRQLDNTLRDWEKGGSEDGEGVDVVCATIAFGMGIDKPDVRYVIHFDMPKSFEGYYQETGRAGRDGNVSKCVLYYSREDAIYLRKLTALSHNKRGTVAHCNNGPAPSQRSKESVAALIDFAERVAVCRHISICRYFGEEIDDEDEEQKQLYCNSMCDVCKSPEKTKKRKADLSSNEYVNSQALKLGNEADVDNDDDRPESFRVTSNGSLSGANGRGKGRASDGPWRTTMFDNGSETGSSAEPSPAPGPQPSIHTPGSGPLGLKRVSSLTGSSISAHAGPRKIARTDYSLSTGSSAAARKSGGPKGFKVPFKVPFKDTTSSTNIVPLPERETEIIDIVESSPRPAKPKLQSKADFPAREYPIRNDIARTTLASLSSKSRLDTAGSSDDEFPERLTDATPPERELMDVDVDLSLDDLDPIALSLSNKKISPLSRTKNLLLTRQTLHKVLLSGFDFFQTWKLLCPGPMSDSARVKTLDSIALELEFLDFYSSISEEWYGQRARTTVKAIKRLPNYDEAVHNGDGMWDDVKDVVEISRRVASRPRATVETDEY